MKVVPQIIIFLIILVIGWFAYDRHTAFQGLVDDIVDYSGVARQIDRPATLASKPSISTAGPAESQQEVSTVAAQEVTAAAPVEDIPSESASEVLQWPEPEKPAESLSTPVKEVVKEPVKAQPVEVITTSPPADSEQAVKSQKAGNEQFPSDAAGSVVKPVLESEKQPPATVKAELSTKPLSPPAPPVSLIDVSKEPAAEATVGNTAPVSPVNGAKAMTEMPVVDRSASKNQAPSSDDAVPEKMSRKQQALAGLAAARAAWHQGDHDQAIMLYGQLVREYKNHPDFAGELGNIYFSKGQTELAVNAYSEAFLRLLRNNDLQRAEQVLGIVYNIDREQAALLREYFPQ